jgi:hypothetical protein
MESSDTDVANILKMIIATSLALEGRGIRIGTEAL